MAMPHTIREWTGRQEKTNRDDYRRGKAGEADRTLLDRKLHGDISEAQKQTGAEFLNEEA